MAQDNHTAAVYSIWNLWKNFSRTPHGSPKVEIIDKWIVRGCKYQCYGRDTAKRLSTKYYGTNRTYSSVRATYIGRSGVNSLGGLFCSGLILKRRKTWSLVSRSWEPGYNSLCQILKHFLIGSSPTGLGQLVEYRTIVREVVAGPHPRFFEYLRRKCCLCNDICKWLDFLVFSDKDDKP